MGRVTASSMHVNIAPEKNVNSAPKISVVMVSYMTGPALLESVNAALQDPDVFELILVDNGNMPEARNQLSQLVMAYDKVRLLQGHGNIGFARGCNYGATLASGDFLLFLNPDAVIKPKAALRLAECGRSLQRPWVTGGMLRDENGQEQRGGRRLELTPASAFVTFTGLSKLPMFKSIHLERENLPAEPVEMPVVSGAFLMMDRASFDSVGGFDERYFLHVEDIDLCRRVKKQGGTVCFVPSAVVMHYGSTSRVRRQKVEKEKLKGFIIYFWRYSDHWWAKALTFLSIPFMAFAIMGRAWWIALREGFAGR